MHWPSADLKVTIKRDAPEDDDEQHQIGCSGSGGSTAKTRHRRKLLPPLGSLKKTELQELAFDLGWTLPDDKMTVAQLREFLWYQDSQTEPGDTKMDFGRYKGVLSFEEVARDDPSYCKWCLETKKPSARMEAFREYLLTRAEEPKKASGPMAAQRPSERDRDTISARGATNKVEDTRPARGTRAAAKREHSDDEWSSMDMSLTSPTPTPTQSPSEYAAYTTALLNRVLNQIDLHPRTSRTLRQSTQMVREQWMEATQTALEQADAKAWMEKDPELTKTTAK